MSSVRDIFFDAPNRVGQGLATYADMDYKTFRQLETIDSVAADQAGMDAVAASSTAMEAVSSSETATDAVAESTLGRSVILTSTHVEDYIWGLDRPSQRIWDEFFDDPTTVSGVSWGTNEQGGTSITFDSGSDFSFDGDIYLQNISEFTFDFEITNTISYRDEEMNIYLDGDTLYSTGLSTGRYVDTLDVSSYDGENHSLSISFDPDDGSLEGFINSIELGQ